MISKLFAIFLSLSPTKSPDTFCITAAVYGEARGESEIGQALVAKTILNRIADTRWSRTACEVVMERKQFAGYGAAWPKTPKDMQTWQQVEAIVKAVMNDQFHPGSCGTATHFHEARITPAWSRTMRRLCRVDNHIFYLEKSR